MTTVLVIHWWTVLKVVGFIVGGLALFLGGMCVAACLLANAFNPWR